MIKRLILIREGTWKPSKWQEGNCRRITFKDIDEPKKYYYLNLTEENRALSNWSHLIIEGNIIDAQIIEGTNIINKFTVPTLIKEMKNA